MATTFDIDSLRAIIDEMIRQKAPEIAAIIVIVKEVIKKKSDTSRKQQKIVNKVAKEIVADLKKKDENSFEKILRKQQKIVNKVAKEIVADLKKKDEKSDDEFLEDVKEWIEAVPKGKVFNITTRRDLKEGSKASEKYVFYDTSAGRIAGNADCPKLKRAVELLGSWM